MNIIKWQLTITHEQHLFGVQKLCPSSGATVGWHGTSWIDAIIPKHQNNDKNDKSTMWESPLNLVLFLAILSSCINVPTSAQTVLWVRPVKMQRMGYIVTVYSTHQMVSKCNKVFRDLFTFRYIIAHIYIKSHCWKCRAVGCIMLHLRLYTVYIQYSFREVFPWGQTVKKKVIDTESAFMKLTLTRNMKFHSNQYIDYLVKLWKYLMLPQLHILDIKYR